MEPTNDSGAAYPPKYLGGYDRAVKLAGQSYHTLVADREAASQCHILNNLAQIWGAWC